MKRVFDQVQKRGGEAVLEKVEGLEEITGEQRGTWSSSP